VPSAFVAWTLNKKLFCFDLDLASEVIGAVLHGQANIVSYGEPFPIRFTVAHMKVL
jgi:hypothetical protein